MLPVRRQVLAFSATFFGHVKDTLLAYMRSPEWVRVGNADAALEGEELDALRCAGPAKS